MHLIRQMWLYLTFSHQSILSAFDIRAFPHRKVLHSRISRISALHQNCSRIFGFLIYEARVRYLKFVLATFAGISGRKAGVETAGSHTSSAEMTLTGPGARAA